MEQASSPLQLLFRRPALRLEASGVGDHVFQEARVSYLGDDTYGFVGAKNGGGEIRLVFLSRLAVSEFLDLSLNHETDLVLVAAEETVLSRVEDVGSSSLSRCLLMIRDAR